MRLYFAPMEGITTHIYRRVHARLFGGADRYYAPFIAPDGSGNFRASSARDVLPENNTGIALVPQLLEAVNRDWENTLFSYIPNTAST